MSVQEVREKVKRLDDNRLTEKFEDAFNELVNDFSSKIEISEFEVDIDRNPKDKEGKVNNDGRPVVSVRVFEMAGETTAQDFCKKTDGKITKVIKGGESVTITLDDGTPAVFAIDDCDPARSNEWVITYKLM